MARVMLNAKKLSPRLWAEAINTTCYIINHVYIRPSIKKTSYKIWKGRKPNLSYFDVFGSKCYILNDKDQRGKFEAKSDEAIFLEYSTTGRAYHIYNKRMKAIKESMNVVVDDFNEFSEKSKEEEIQSNPPNSQPVNSQL